MKNLIKRLYYRVKNFKKHVLIASGVVLDMNVKFEGFNKIGKDSEISSSTIGLGTYISPGARVQKTAFGRYCSIGRNLQTCLGIHPSHVFVSTHPAFFSVKKQAGFSFIEENIFQEHKYINDEKTLVLEIGNDVWIGNNVIIMDGLRIGDGAIIGSGSIVTKDVESYAIVVGTPAKKIRDRFTSEEIEYLLESKWWNWDFSKLQAQSSSFSDISKFIKNR